MRGFWMRQAAAAALMVATLSGLPAHADSPPAAPPSAPPASTGLPLGTGTAPAAPPAGDAATLPALPPPPPALPPPAPEVVAVVPRRYGDRGTPEIALGLGYSSQTGFLAAGGFRYFVLDGVAPGVEGTYVQGATDANAGTYVPSYGLALATLRLVPLRTPSVALAITGRTGRVFFADHADGWGAGGGLALLLSVGGGAALELGYDILWLLPSSFCADLSSCTLQGPVIGIRFGL